MKRSTWLHLRIPFSFYLLPIFCFAVSQAPHPRLAVTLLIAIILHLMAYPASQGFNSYYDRDQGSIGGLLARTDPGPLSDIRYAVGRGEVTDRIESCLFEESSATRVTLQRA